MKTIEIEVDVERIDATLNLIQVSAAFCKTTVTTSLMIKVETGNEHLVGMLAALPGIMKREKAALLAPVIIASQGLKAQKKAHFTPNVPAPEVQKKGVGYCRNCGEPRLRGKFCSEACGNQYAVRRVNLRHKGIRLDELFTGKLGKRYCDFTLAEFDQALFAGEIPEGAKIVTPEGNLRKIVMQGGKLTFEEYFPSQEIKEQQPVQV